jgi:RNA polymerase sigma factor (TIGR02999 family)
MQEITNLLKAWNNGDKNALERLMPLVDAELKKIARSYMRRERPGHILQPTALVHEALMKLIRENVTWENRKQFYAIVAKRMRQVLIDYAKKAKKVEHVELTDAVMSYKEKSKELILLENALTELAKTDERMATIVEYRYFIGLTIPEVARLLNISPKTVERDWNCARSWLKREMTQQVS